MPCPYGVNIPQNFALLNNFSMEENSIKRWLIRRKYRKLVGSKEKLDKDYPNGSATLCVNCRVCVEKCPQSISIPEELVKVDAILGKREPI